MYKWGEEEGRASPGAFHNVGFDHNEGILAISMELTLRKIGRVGDRRPRKGPGTISPSLNTQSTFKGLPRTWVRYNMGVVRRHPREARSQLVGRFLRA